MASFSQPAPPSTGKLLILFIRHGETQDNIDRVLQGLRDTSPTPKGHTEASFLATKLASQHPHIDALYHSPLTRIRQTISPILASRPDVQAHADADLGGQSLGELEGGSYDSIDLSNPRSADGGPSVESFDDFVSRLKRVFGRIVGKEAPLVREGDRTVVIATHGVGITSLLRVLEGSEGNGRKMARRGSQAFEVR